MPDHDFSFGYQPGQEIGYDQITASVNITATTLASPTTIIACAEHAFDGAPVLLTVFFPYVFLGTVAACSIGVALAEGGTTINEMLFFRHGNPGGTTPYTFVNALYRFTPSAGRHTYVIGAYTGSTTGSPAVGAGAGTGATDVPAFARFTKV